MGWITFNKPKHISPSDYFRDMFKNEPNYELLDIAIVQRTECYMAVRQKDTGKVFALVYLLTYGRGWDNFGYKDMSEFAGPGASKCPKRILDLLSPLTDEDDPNGYARDWRSRCLEAIDKRKVNGKLKAGDVIKLNREIQFSNGGKYQTFMKLDSRNCWMAMYEGNDGKLYNHVRVRFTLTHLEYEKIENPNL